MGIKGSGWRMGSKSTWDTNFQNIKFPSREPKPTHIVEATYDPASFKVTTLVVKRKTVEEIEEEFLQGWAMACVGSKLVPSDCHDEAGAMMTEDKQFFFVPVDGDPVMTQSRIGKPPEPAPGSSRICIEVLKCYPGNHLIPDDYDFVEVGERSNNMIDAVREAARYALDRKLEAIGEGLWSVKESQMEPYYDEMYKESQRQQTNTNQ